MMRIVAAIFLLLPTACADADDALDLLRKQAAEAHAAALVALRHEADAALKQEPVRVVDKTSVPPSGDKRDYYDLSPYFWPNPNSPDGLPYIFRDGHVNPEVETKRFNRIGEIKVSGTD